jgi:hypothetical protein
MKANITSGIFARNIAGKNQRFDQRLCASKAKATSLL